MNEVEMERRLTETESRSKSNCRRIDDLERRQDCIEKLTAALAGVKTEVTVLQNDNVYIKKDIGEIKTDVRAISTSMSEEPKKKWDNMTGTLVAVIAAVVGGVLTFLIERLL